LADVIAWANRHGVTLAAVQELLHELGQGYAPPQPDFQLGHSEAAVTSRVRLEAASKGVILWRNQVGALPDANGRLVRFGLCNDSAIVNREIKSSDWIGMRAHLVTPADVGHVLGQFVAREIKEEGWTFNVHDKHQEAQAKFGRIVTSYGGDFAFCTGVGSL
jgi:hypothetical protein